MRQEFAGWAQVAKVLKSTALAQEKLEATAPADCRLNAGQRGTLRAIARRLPHNGVLVADEVGMGKTRVAVAVADAVTRSGGRVAILIPPGLGFQWADELRIGGCLDVPPILSSLQGYFRRWSSDATDNAWFQEPILVLSHVFANWRLADASAPWRWALLPELYAQDRKSTSHRWPRGYLDSSELADPEVQAAGLSIHDAIPSSSRHPARRRMTHLAKNTPWPGSLYAEEYARTGALRPLLEQAVGLGLGAFDLIIIDEAHKSRGHETGLSRLLSNVVLPSTSARRMSVTATPVELAVDQWSQSLARLGAEAASVESIGTTVHDYAQAVRRVKDNWPQRNPDAIVGFRAAAAAFQSALSPFVLRRDKRQEGAVQMFETETRESWDQYRHDREIVVELENLTPAWQQAICAAESLGVAVRPRESQSPTGSRRAQLMRLTTGNGHGIAAWLDFHDEEEEVGTGTAAGDGQSPTSDVPTMKRDARIDWWCGVIATAFSSAPNSTAASDNALYDHPAILAAVTAIEGYTGSGAKVLVFGKFNRPMRALVDLLNAREMLRRVTANEHWPSTKAGPRAAAAAAKRQLGSSVDLSKLEAKLAARYDKEQRSRAKRRDALRRPLTSAAQGGSRLSHRERDLLLAFLEAWQSDPASALPVLRALEALSPPRDPTDAQLAQAFIDLIRAVSDRDISGVDEEGAPTDQGDAEDQAPIEESWDEILQHISGEFDGPEGGFARHMFGQTSQQSRRMMQLAFNRPYSHPRVLVAQSMVGREGLNLHEQCRVVVLLHPEWNPAVVEQQVGRVDRLNSRWEKDLEAWVRDREGAVPRIEIRPVIFKGTYDEMNWAVLRERQDEFRAQLSGIVIPTRRAQEDPALAAEIAISAPSFVPPT